jgi:hypothetical protein
MKDFVDAFLELVQKHTGVPIPEVVVPYIIVAAVVVPAVASMYLTIRRWRGNLRAISSELEAAADLIAGDTSKRLNSVADRLEQTMAQRFDAIQASLELKTEVAASPADREIDSEPAEQRRGFRLNAARSVRNTVMQKWLEGRDLKRMESDPNLYSFVGRNEAGTLLKIILTTPYRATIGQDSRMPFALDVWVDGYKKLNFEWDAEGTYALRGFTRGDWIEDLSEWRIVSILADIAERQAA